MPIPVLLEPAREIPVADDVDLCVIGGSCTGVFAAVRAARLGLKVALVENNIILGGMATAAQVNEWHSLYDMSRQTRIIGGLTWEVLETLRGRGVVQEGERGHCGPISLFNSAEMALELEALASGSGIRIFLKTPCVGGIREGNRLRAAIIEDKSGRRAIAARMFIDASGDGDLLRRTGFAAWKNETLQPVDYQMLAVGLTRITNQGGDIWTRIRPLAEKFGYPLENGRPWINAYPTPITTDLMNVYGPRQNGMDASDADHLTEAVLRGQRHLRSFLDMVRTEIGSDVSVVALAHSLGIRETWHAHCLLQLHVEDVLAATLFPDTIGSGTYPVDIHSSEGTLLRLLDGREQVVAKDGGVLWRRWRDESEPGPAYYNIPYRCLVPVDSENLLVAGRLLDADREAFGGVRVMVNMNQTGEAAGVAAWLALRDKVSVSQINVKLLRATLRAGGSILPS